MIWTEIIFDKRYGILVNNGLVISGLGRTEKLAQSYACLYGSNGKDRLHVIHSQTGQFYGEGEYARLPYLHNRPGWQPDQCCHCLSAVSAPRVQRADPENRRVASCPIGILTGILTVPQIDANREKRNHFNAGIHASDVSALHFKNSFARSSSMLYLSTNRLPYNRLPYPTLCVQGIFPARTLPQASQPRMELSNAH